MLPFPVTNFEIQKYYQEEPRFNGVYSGDNLPNIKNGAYSTNLDEYKSIGTNWIAVYVNCNNVIDFDNFRVAVVPKNIKKFIGNKDFTTDIYTIQAHDSVMCPYFCIGFIDFTFNNKRFTGSTAFFLQIVLKRMIK